MELYEWQKSCMNEWITNHTRGIADVITGGGKTTLALACAKHLYDLYHSRVHIRIVVPTVPLAIQWKKSIQEFFPELDNNASIGLYYGKQKDSVTKAFTIYVINSARHTISRHILTDMKTGHHTFLICDECHRYTGNENSLIFRFRTAKEFRYDFYHCLGLSATPQCNRFESVLVPALGNLFYRYGSEEASQDGIISPFHIIHVSVPFNGEEIKQYGVLTTRISKMIKTILRNRPELKNLSLSDFYAAIFATAKDDEESPEAILEKSIRNRKSLLANAESRTLCLIDLTKELARDETEKCIIFSERIDQAETLYQLLKRQFPGRVGHYHSEMSSEMKRHCLSMFREGEFRFLVTCKALDEGLDVPDATTAIVVSSSSINRQRIQRLGRVLRRAQTKLCAKLYYFYIPNTVEKEDYLDIISPSNNDVAKLRYLPLEHTFVSEIYEEAVIKVLQQVNPEPRRKKEMMRHITRGLIRTDWLLSVSTINNLIQTSEQKETQNYYYCMKQIASHLNH